MTAQITDTFEYRGKTHYLAGINGSKLFEPSQQGVEAVSWSTGCWRGYHCGYEVIDGALFLIRINLGLGLEDQEAISRGDGPHLFGKVPQRYTEYGWREDMHNGEVRTSWESTDFVVTGLREPISFTGGLLIGDDFIQELYVRLGYPHAYQFHVVYQLVFDAGHLVEEHDRSAEMAELRENILSRSHEPINSNSRREVKEWIKQCMTLEALTKPI